MREDWWPAPLVHVAAEEPWSQSHVVVAEVRSYDEQPHAGQRTTFSALVPVDQIDEVAKNLSSFHTEVSANGPHPVFSEDSLFRPEFWMGATDLPSRRYEPLVLSWTSHHSTVLQPDPGFLMTYGLVPRPIKDGQVHWDDPAAPRYDIVIVSPPAVWDFPLYTQGYVSVAKDVLQDYLTLRRMALVQVFWAQRWGSADPEIDGELKDEEAVSLKFPDREIQLNRDMQNKGMVCAQVWGARVVAMPKDLPISSDPHEAEGLNWPGIDGPVANEIAERFRMDDRVYVSDAVLGVSTAAQKPSMWRRKSVPAWQDEELVPEVHGRDLWALGVKRMAFGRYQALFLVLLCLRRKLSPFISRM